MASKVAAKFPATGTATNLMTGTIPKLVALGTATAFGGLPGYLISSVAENALTGTATRGEAMVLQALIDRLLNKNGLGVRALQPNTGGAP